VLFTLLAVLLVLPPLLWAAILTARRCRSQGERRVAILLAVIGAGLGVWGGCYLEYPVGSGLVVCGAPLPVGAFARESDGVWRDFIMPLPWFNALCDFLFFTLASLLPLRLWQHLQHPPADMTPPP
jgi:hypothetical protein